MKAYKVMMDDREHADLKLCSVFFDKSMNQIIRMMIRRFINENKGKIKEAAENVRNDCEERT